MGEGFLVFDAQPLVALALAEPSRAAVKARLRGLGPDRTGVICSVNLCELLYIAHQRAGAEVAAEAAHLVARVGISVVDADADLATRAAALKVRYRLGLGDAFAAALARSMDAPLVTADADFLPLADDGLKLDWLGE